MDPTLAWLKKKSNLETFQSAYIKSFDSISISIRLLFIYVRYNKFVFCLLFQIFKLFFENLEYKKAIKALLINSYKFITKKFIN